MLCSHNPWLYILLCFSHVSKPVLMLRAASLVSELARVTLCARLPVTVSNDMFWIHSWTLGPPCFPAAELGVLGLPQCPFLKPTKTSLF